MGSISQTIKVNVSVIPATALLTQYGVPAIVGESTSSTKNTPKKYTSIDTVGTDHGTSSKLYIAARSAFDQGVRTIYLVSMTVATAGSPTATEIETALDTLGSYATNNLITGVCLAGIGCDQSSLTAKLKTFAETNDLIFTVTNPNGESVSEIASAVPALSSANGYFLAHADSNQTGDIAAAALGTLSVLKPWVTPFWKSIDTDVNAYFTPSEGTTLEAAKANYIADLGDGTNRMSQAYTTLATGTPKFIDITRFRYYVALTIQNAIAQYRMATEKIPYTATGLKYIQGEIAGVLESLISAGAISSYTVTMPDINDIDAADIENRKLSDINVRFKYSGDMQDYEVNLIMEAI
jgi:hypothetical protein